jgi:hypothetical protein
MARKKKQAISSAPEGVLPEPLEVFTGEIQTSALFPAMQTVLSGLIHSEVFPSLPAPTISLQKETISSFDDFVKCRSTHDVIADPESVSALKGVHVKYVELHSSVQENANKFMEERCALWDKVKQSRPLLVHEQEFVDGRLKDMFLNLSRQINHAFIEIPHSYSIRRRKKGNLPRNAVKILKKWLFDHFSHPYPSIEEKVLVLLLVKLT